jgi:hypothetical protein
MIIKLQFIIIIQMNSALPSNRKFGLLFATVFLGLSSHGFVKSGISLKVYSSLIISILFFIASVKNSELLTPLNKAWFLLGQALNKIVSPIVLGAIFFLLITPIGLVAKLLGRDTLKLKRPQSKSYWSTPIGSNSDSESFKNQF